MQAFLNNAIVKDKYLSRVKAHRLADELVKGQIGQEGKGCAVWCTLNEYNHAAYEKELGIPEWLARVEETIFEGMPDERSQSWPEDFLSAIKLGSDLDKIKTPFLIFVLEQSLASMRRCTFDAEKFPAILLAIKQSESAVTEMIRFHKEGIDLSAAWSAKWSAENVKFADKILELIKEL